MLDTFFQKTLDTYQCSIYLSSNYDLIKQLCQEFCFHKGLCVTIERLDFVYTGGAEAGVRVGLINYPKYPKTQQEISNLTKELGCFLREKTFQDSVLILCPHFTTWISCREPNTK